MTWKTETQGGWLMQPVEARFGSEIIHALLELHTEITEAKYAYLKIVQSHSVKEGAKSELKGTLVEIAGRINEFISAARFRRINKFNLDDAETGIREFTRATRSCISRFLRAARKALPPPARRGRLDRTAGEAEIDAMLLESRVFEQRALEKDKLDYLNSVKSYLVEVTATGPEKGRQRGNAKARLDGELLQLKIRNYKDGLAGHHSINPEVLFRVAARIERALREQVRINVIGTAGTHPAAPNHGELYVVDQGNGNYSLSFRDRGLAFLLDISLYRALEGPGVMYAGETSGWAESGLDRVAFSLQDRQQAGTSGGEPAAAFLRRAGLDGIYESLRRACVEKATEMQRLQQKVENQMKQRVCEALDAAL